MVSQQPMDEFTAGLADDRAQAILRWRWAVLVAGSILCLFLEIYEHEPHLFDGRWDREEVLFSFEYILYGVLIPFAVWCLLTWIAKNYQQRTLERRAAWLRVFTLRLSQCQEWGELTEFLTRFPATLLPLAGVSLFLYNHREARLEFARAWPEDAQAPLLGQQQPCTVCPAYQLAWTTLWRAATCPPVLDDAAQRAPEELCLPLAVDHLLVGALRLTRLPNQSFAPSEIAFFNDLAPHLALALTLSIARQAQLKQDRNYIRLSERRWIAYNLHASVIQQLGSLNFNLHRLIGDRGQPESAEAQATLELLSRVSHDLYSETRSFLNALRTGEPAILLPWIEDYARKMGAEAGFEVIFQAQNPPSAYSPQLSCILFGFVQESLNNIRKHAHARRVEIIVRHSGAEVGLRVADDGVGFEPAQVYTGDHCGLAMMLERARSLRGELRITSAPGRGASLEFKLPYSGLPADFPFDDFALADQADLAQAGRPHDA